MESLAIRTKSAFFALISMILLGTFCFSQSITLSRRTGPPTTQTVISGDSFPPNATIDIFFDQTDLALASTDNMGAFSNVNISIPASALPGKHRVSAVARLSSASAKEGFLVRTNWTQYRFTDNRLGFNPYENVISPATVGALQMKWSFATGNQLISSPAVVAGVVYVNSYDNTLYALKASSGSIIWSRSGSYFEFLSNRGSGSGLYRCLLRS